MQQPNRVQQCLYTLNAGNRGEKKGKKKKKKKVTLKLVTLQ